MNKNFRKIIGVLIIMVALLISIPVEKVSAGDQSEERSIAQELAYGSWSPYATDWIKYQFNDSNLKIVNVEYADSYGDTRMQVQFIKNGVTEVYATSYLNIQYNPKSDKYEMRIEKVRHGSKIVENGVTNRKFIKVYWDINKEH